MRSHMNQKLLSVLLALAILMGVLVTVPLVYAADTYSDPELARAVKLGFGTHSDDNASMTYAEFFVMIDHTVELADASKLVEWQARLPEARMSNSEITRLNAMMCVFSAAEILGADYYCHNSDWLIFTNNMPWDTGEWALDDFYGDTLRTPIGFDSREDGGGGNFGGTAYFYGLGRISMYSEKPLFDYDHDQKTMRPGDVLSYQEALLAALRLLDSGLKPTERALTDEDRAILTKADERREAIRNSPTEVTVTGKKYYVSNKGNDKNNGLSPEKAWSTPARANKAKLKPGDGVFFERGSVWRMQQIVAQKGVTYSAYGEGAKPQFLMSPENGVGAEKWSLWYDEGGKKIWKFHSNMQDVGSIVFNDGEQWAHKAMHALTGGKVVSFHGYDGGERVMLNDPSTPFDLVASLDKDLMCYSDDKDSNFEGEIMDGYAPKRKVPLFLRCDAGNPGDIFQSIEFLSWGAQIATAEQTVYDNLCLLYTSCHSVFGDSSFIVQNCEIGWTGGGIQCYAIGFSPDEEGIPARFDTGISSIGVYDGFTVSNNYIYQVYDEGISNQGGYWSDNRNITYTNNLIEYCTMGIGIFYADYKDHPVDDETPLMTNVRIDGNMILYSGYGFGYSYALGGNNHIDSHEFYGAIHLHDFENPSENFSITNNILYVSRGSLVTCGSMNHKPIVMGNTYIQNDFGVLCVYRLQPREEASLSYFRNNINAENYIADIIGDETGVHVN